MPGSLPAATDKTGGCHDERVLDETLPPYGETAVRPDWADLPGGLRTAIENRLCCSVRAAATAGGGFTRGFAAVLTSSNGGTAFVKAAPADTPLAGFYAREAALTAVLPDGVPVARPRWTLEAAGWVAVCFDALDGRMPRLPWRAGELAAALDAWALTAGLHPHPVAAVLAGAVPLLADVACAELDRGAAALRGDERPPPLVPRGRLAELAELEGLLPALAADVGVIHGDLRIDNVLIDHRAWICDWAWPVRGPAWFDTAVLLVTAYGDHDVDALFAAHPTSLDAPPEALDATLAAMSGHWLASAAGPPSDASPHSRAHQRFSGSRAVAWLGTRRGWS